MKKTVGIVFFFFASNYIPTVETVRDQPVFTPHNKFVSTNYSINFPSFPQYFEVSNHLSIIYQYYQIRYNLIQIIFLRHIKDFVQSPFVLGTR